MFVNPCWNKQRHARETAENKALGAGHATVNGRHATITPMKVARHCIQVARPRSFVVPSRALGTFATEIPKRPEPAYPGHIPLNWFENAFLAVGSGVISLLNPHRGGARGSHSTQF